MEAIQTITKIIEIALFIWAVTATMYMFVYAILGTLYSEKRKKIEINESVAPRIALLIPAYKEDKVIIQTVQSALRQLYPVGKAQVIVVADSLERATLNKLNALHIKVMEVAFEKSTKAKALNAALQILPESFDMAVILDADNIIRPDFLSQMAEAYLQGHQAIQGHRTAKNYHTGYSLLDAISEEINNHIFCKGQQYIGMSSRLTGSGMGFEFKSFKHMMSEIDAVGGFDKELELKLLAAEIKIQYLPHALIYDEKVSKSDVMVNQRSRWISAQFFYMKKYLPGSLSQLIKNKNLDYFNKSVQLIIPPRVFMLLLLGSGILLSLTSGNLAFTYNWLILSSLYLFVFVIAFPKKFIGKHLVKLIAVVPNTLIQMIYSIPVMFRANKKFIHTPHESI